MAFVKNRSNNLPVFGSWKTRCGRIAIVWEYDYTASYLVKGFMADDKQSVSWTAGGRQLSSGVSDLDLIDCLSILESIPVEANGDIRTVDQWVRTVGDWAEKKGWNEKERSAAEWAILKVTEIAEAFEAYRNNEPIYWKREDGKPEGQASEYADVVIRIMHWFDAHQGKNGCPTLERALLEKMEYNHTRPYRHGNKQA